MKTEKIDFDKYADDYEKILGTDLKFFGEENSYFAEYKIKLVGEIIKKDNIRILEYGCGIGRNLKYFKKFFPYSEITGCDISEKSLDIAKKTNKDIEFFQQDGNTLKEYTKQFDIIFTSNVLHHIAKEERQSAINDISVMLKNKGSFFIFEHNPYNPLTQYIVKRCPFDADAVLLRPTESISLIIKSGFKVIQKKYTLFFPSFLKPLRFFEKYIGWLPFGGQYYVWGSKK